MIIIAPDDCLLGGRPAVGFGPILEEMNPRTFLDLPLQPRTLDFVRKSSTITTNNSYRKIYKSDESLVIALYC